MRSRIIPAIVVTLTATAAASQRGAEPTFEAASIKPTSGSVVTGRGAASIGFPAGGRYSMRDGSAVAILRSAYPDVIDVVGAPDWAYGAARFDVEAKGTDSSTVEQVTAMLRTMMADRFRLLAHREMRERPTYDLMLARADRKLGSELKIYAGDCNAYVEARRAGRPPLDLPAPTNGGPACGMSFSDRGIHAGGMTVSRLAGNLRSLAGREVIDRTGLEGFYEVR